ncbi:MAG: hypothetical protein L0Z50_38945 [Verrucomicrobiales bacterium]|nr:hypothetical protein [Verrucomicrobiales bacterium]
MKKSDPLKQFVLLYQSLRNEKAQLESRLGEINEALGEAGEVMHNNSLVRPSSVPGSTVQRRIKNPISLPKAVLQLTSKRPLTKPEILLEVEKLGYRFKAKDPLNSLNTVLYGKKPKFRNEEGKFSPMVVPMPASQADARSAIRKRKMSPAARAKISAAARARWARIKRAKGG